MVVDYPFLMRILGKRVIVWHRTHSAAHMDFYTEIMALLLFEEGEVGPSNVVTKFIKCVKTKGAIKGK